MYIKERIEPYIKGLDWENFVDEWRRSLGNGKSKEKSVVDRVLHMIGIGGLYMLVIVVAAIKCITPPPQGVPPSGIPYWMLLILVAGLLLAGAAMWNFFTVYPEIEKKTHDVCEQFERNPPLH